LLFYYKPIRILHTLVSALDWRPDLAPPSILLLTTLQAVLFVVFAAAGAAKAPFDATTTFGTLALFAVFSLAPPLVAWAGLHTSIDIIFYMYATLALAVAFFVQGAARRSWQTQPQGRA
jgi:hypothetical protein